MCRIEFKRYLSGSEQHSELLEIIDVTGANLLLRIGGVEVTEMIAWL
jgi:hypothetical protein